MEEGNAAGLDEKPALLTRGAARFPHAWSRSYALYFVPQSLSVLFGAQGHFLTARTSVSETEPTPNTTKEYAPNSRVMRNLGEETRQRYPIWIARFFPGAGWQRPCIRMRACLREIFRGLDPERLESCPTSTPITCSPTLSNLVH